MSKLNFPLCCSVIFRRRLTICCIFACLQFTALSFGDMTLDLATNTDAMGAPDITSGFLEGARFEWGAMPGGTGNIQSIVRYADSNFTPPAARDGIQEGYNTSGRPVPFKDMNTSLSFTRNAQLGAVPIVTVASVNYYEFLFDVNQNNGAGSKLSLDKIQIYTSTTGSQVTTTLSSLGTLRYNMDATMNNEILLDGANIPGSGTVDMRMLVPVSNFAGALNSDFIYLYSQSGGKGATWRGTAGNEEWAFVGSGVVIPEPSAFLLVGLIGGLGCVTASCLKRRAATKVSQADADSEMS